MTISIMTLNMTIKYMTFIVMTVSITIKHTKLSIKDTLHMNKIHITKHSDN